MTAGEQDTELQRLREQVADLQARLAAVPPVTPREVRIRRRHLRIRRTLAAVLVALAGFGLVTSVIGVWAGRTTLNTGKWVATVAPLPENPEINTAMADYITDQVFSSLQVEDRLAVALPPKATFLAGPVTGTVHDYLRDRVRTFMGTDTFQQLWTSANRYAHAKVVAILEGKSDVVTVDQETVTINLLPIINDVLVTISNELPALFGKQLQLPTLTTGQIPPDLRQKVQTAVGVTLPADFGQMAFYSHGTLSGLQDAVVLFKRGLLILIFGTLACLGLALWVSPGRRRTILQFGVVMVTSVVVLTAVLRGVRDQILTMVPAGTYRDAVSVAVHEIFRSLRQRGDQMLWIGLIIAAVAYLAGPGRLPVWIRGHVVSWSIRLWNGLRAAATSDALRIQTARHLDALRMAGLVAAAVVALLFSSWTAFLVILIVLLAYEVAVTLVARPPAGADVTAGAESRAGGG